MLLLQATPLLTLGASIAAFLFGCVAPDLDHPKINGKTVLLRWLGRITHHRGHWHSLLATLIYGGVIFLPCFLLLTHWIYPVLFGMGGYFSHLAEDDLNSIIKGTTRNAVKIF